MLVALNAPIQPGLADPKTTSPKCVLRGPTANPKKPNALPNHTRQQKKLEVAPGTSGEPLGNLRGISGEPRIHLASLKSDNIFLFLANPCREPETRKGKYLFCKTFLAWLKARRNILILQNLSREPKSTTKHTYFAKPFSRG